MSLNKSMFTPKLIDKDVELQLMIQQLKFAPKMKILELGCSGTEISSVLFKQGCEVWGVDLKPYTYSITKFIQGDFLKVDLPTDYFDIAIDISALHHFGMPAYGNELNLDADIKASEKVWLSLKHGGVWFLTMDRFKAEFVPNIVNFVRQYNYKTFKERVCRGFYVEYMRFYDVKMNEVSLDSPYLDVLCAKLKK